VLSTNIPSLSKYTISIWVSPLTYGQQWESVFSTSNSSSNGFQIDSDNNNSFRVSIDNGNNDIVLPIGNYDVNKWYLLTITTDESSTKSYLNGKFINSATVVTASNYFEVFKLGENRNTGGYFHGKIDDISILNKVLSAYEISEIYNSSFSPVERLYDNLSISKIQLNTIGNKVDNFSVASEDNDTASVKLTSTGDNITREDNSDNDSLSVVLTAQPLGTITLSLSSSDNVSGGFLDNQSLTFTASNWNTAQNVTVFAVKDYIDDGTYGSGDNTTFTVTIDNVSSDNSSDLYDDSTLFTNKALFQER